MSERHTEEEKEAEASNKVASEIAVQNIKKIDPSFKVRQERPLLLPVPDYRSRRFTQSKKKKKKVNIKSGNDAHLLASSKNDPLWHCKVIPTERRRIRCLPIFAWNPNETPPVERILHIEEPEQDDVLKKTDQFLVQTTRPLRKLAVSIPLESKKRKKKAEVEKPSRHHFVSSCETETGAPLKRSKYELAPSTVSSLLIPSPATTSVPISTAVSRKINSSTMTVKASSSGEPEPLLPQLHNFANDALQCEAVDLRLLSPPMRIVSVRSLADETTPTLDEPLGERILFQSGNDSPEGSRSPLYIFNPAHRKQSLGLDNEDQPAPLRSMSMPTQIMPTNLTQMDCLTEPSNKSQRKKDRENRAVNDHMVEDASRRVLLNVFEDDFVPIIPVKQEMRSPKVDDGGLNFSEESCLKNINPKSEYDLANMTRIGGTSSSFGELKSSCGVTVKSKHNSHLENGEVSDSGNTVHDDRTTVMADEQGRVYETEIESFVSTPQSSPFGDSEHSDISFEEFEAVHGPIHFGNYSQNIIKHVENEDSGRIGDRVNQFVSDHCYSKLSIENVPVSRATTAQRCDQGKKTHSSKVTTELVRNVEPRSAPHSATTALGNSEMKRTLPVLSIRSYRIKKNGFPIYVTGVSNSRSQLSRARSRKNSSSSTGSSTDKSCPKTSFVDSKRRAVPPFRDPQGLGLGSAQQVVLERTKRQKCLDQSVRKKVIESMIVLKQMQLMSFRDNLLVEKKHKAVNKLSFLDNLVDYFRKNEFSKEPLNRSILNAMADWLSPLSDGELPPLKLRKKLLELIKHFTLTTPTHVFQASSIEGVLKLLSNHPKECWQNKSLAWDILSSWRNDRVL